jgi:hypothetical protein
MKIAFPAIAVSRRDSFLVVDSIDNLTTCSTSGWRNGYYNELGLFDSEGSYWPIQASINNPPNILDRLLNRRIAVDLAAGEPELDSADRIVRFICDLIDNDPDDLYCQFISHAELKEKFRTSADPRLLVELAGTLGAEDD